MKLLLVLVALLPSATLANKYNINPEIIYTGKISCIDSKDAINEILGAVTWDCSRYGMNPIVYAPLIDYFLCESDFTKVNLSFVYRCELPPKKEREV